MKKYIFIALAVVLLGALGFQLYRKIGKKEGYAKQGAQVPVAVVAAPVERVMLQDLGEFSGSLIPNAQFDVSPKLGGKLEKLYVDVGDTVKKGELIAELEDEEVAQQVEQAKAELEVAQASLEDSQNALLLAEREHERVKALFEKQIASAAELDRVEAEFKTAESQHRVSLAQIKQKEAALKAAEVRLSYTNIRATWNRGEEIRVIGERFVDEGALLRANEPIVSVLDIDTLVAVIQVIERDYPRVHEGQRAVVTTDLFPEREFEANVTRVSPILKEAARQAEVRVEVPNHDRLLKPGMFVRVKIEFSKKEGAPSVPLSSLVQRNGEQGLFLIEDDGRRARFVPVRVGLVHEGRAEILDPSLSGMVVILGQHLLEDGSPVILSEEGRGTQPMQPASTLGGEKASGGTSR
jgi:RND family efflux transporter MFP subunit